MRTERDKSDQKVSLAEKTAKCLPDVAELPQVLTKKPKYGEDETNFLFLGRRGIFTSSKYTQARLCGVTDQNPFSIYRVQQN